MKTRFDENEVWISTNAVIPIAEMETAHLVNTLRMFIIKPLRTMDMIVRDIERSHGECEWTPDSNNSANIIKRSVSNVTSMSFAELAMYAINSELGKAIQTELKDRGVNVDNIIALAFSEKEWE